MDKARKVYADYAASAPMRLNVKSFMSMVMDKSCGNPSSIHQAGLEARQWVESSRENIACWLNCSPKEIIFTSGGSEADNQAILSAALKGKAEGKTHIVSTVFEHHAVLCPLERLQDEGFSVTLLEVSEDGRITPEQVENAIRGDTCLVTVMYANNEIGTIQPIRDIGRVCKAHGVPFHTDAVQAVGHVPIDVEDLGVDYLSMSAHKFGGPKGVGALYVREGAYVYSLIEGGDQENFRRAGTENVPGIYGMAIALLEAKLLMEEETANIQSFRRYLLDEMTEIPGIHFHGNLTETLPGILNCRFDGVEGESLVLMMDKMGVCISAGAACTSGSLNPSHVITALGVSREEAHGAVRISLGPNLTLEDVQYIAEQLKTCVALLRGEKVILGAKNED